MRHPAIGYIIPVISRPLLHIDWITTTCTIKLSLKACTLFNFYGSEACLGSAHSASASVEARTGNSSEEEYENHSIVPQSSTYCHKEIYVIYLYASLLPAYGPLDVCYLLSNLSLGTHESFGVPPLREDCLTRSTFEFSIGLRILC